MATWDSEQFKDYLQKAGATLHNPGPLEDCEKLYLVIMEGQGKTRCDLCTAVIELERFWVSDRHTVCTRCASSLRTSTSRGSSHRCIECSLVRCASEGSRCEECYDNMRNSP